MTRGVSKSTPLLENINLCESDNNYVKNLKGCLAPDRVSVNETVYVRK
jgi:hypothetical protein